MDYGDVLGNAWRIVWKHKVLWIFGILAGCGTGSGGGGGGTGWRTDAPFSEGARNADRYVQNAGQWISEHWWVVALAILVLAALWALAVLLSTIGKISLIRGAFQADGGVETLRFGELFRESLPFFWRVFLLTFLIGLALLIVFLPLVVVGMVTAGLAFICLLPLICLLVPATWVLQIVIRQAEAAMVLENLSIRNGLRRGWAVFRANLGPMLLIWLITGLLDIVLGFVLVLPFVIIAVPAIIGTVTSQGDLPTAALLISLAGCAVYLPVLLLLNGILTAYTQSAWTLTYLRVTTASPDTGMPAVSPANA